MSPSASTTHATGRLLLALVAIAALVMSFAVTANPVSAGAEETGKGNIAIFKTMCDSIGKQDVCNGRDTSLEGYSIDYDVYEGSLQGAIVQTITVTLGENAGGGGNTGGGSQGRAEGADLPVGDYVVCEAPHPNPIAYKAGEADVPLDALPRPEPGNGGSTGGPQTEVDNCIAVEVTTGTAELKFLDQKKPEPETGSLLVLKTDDGEPGAPLAGAEFTVEDDQGSPVGDGTFTTEADGTFCVQNLTVGGVYTVTETVPPAGHELADPASQDVTVEEVGTCADREAGPDATFVNPAIVLEPGLVIDKVADAEVITIAEGVADPAVVTWTLSYTLTNGPVHNAVITDPVPAGFTFLSASDGGTFAAGVVTWQLGELTSSGSVSFQTTVDVETISRTDATVNTATIDSDETEPDDGSDSVTVTEEGELGGTPTPAPTDEPEVPDTAMGDVSQLPATVLSLLLLSGLATMLYLRLSRER